MSDTTERDAVRAEFYARHHHGHQTLTAARAAVRDDMDSMTEEIVRVRAENAALRADRDNLSSQLRDCTDDRDGWKQRAERFERKNAALLEDLRGVVGERDRAERILAALREPSEIITDAFFEEYWNTANSANALRAAVAAAEREVGGR